MRDRSVLKVGVVLVDEVGMSSRFGLLAVAAATTVLVAVFGVLPSGVSGYQLPDTVTLYVAVPGGEEADYLMADDAFHEAELAMAWVEQQTGRTFRRGPGYAHVVELALPESAYQGPPQEAAALIAEQVIALDVAREETFPVVMADLRTDALDAQWLTCGIGGQVGVVMFIRNCPQQRLSTSSQWGSKASITIAHELLHGLGAAQPCGRSADSSGHVTDDPNDILRAEAVHDVPPHLITLDAGRDDYFDHAIPGCHDIADSPLWQ